MSSAFDAARDLRLHHVGVACSNITVEASILAALGYVLEGSTFTDERQGVRGLFLAGQQPRLELLESISESAGVLTPWLRAGTSLYHLAYETDRLQDAIDHFRAERAKLVRPPVPATAFNGRNIAFLMLPNALLIELIEQS